MRRALLVYNPVSGRRRHGARLGAVLSALREGGIEAEAVPTQARGHATQLAHAASREGGFDLVLAYGGDGTVREVAAGLLGSGATLGVIPGGTVNVVAIAFGLPKRVLDAARRLGRLEPREIDVGLCGGHPFLMQATSGIEAYLIARLSGRLKKHLGFAGPVLQALPVLARYRFPELQLVADGRELRATGAMICNISELAGHYRSIPSGRFDDRRLDLLLFRGEGRRAAVGFACDLFLGRHSRRADIEILTGVERVRFEGPAGSFVQIDGDPLSDPHPIEVHLAPDRLRALVEPVTASDRA